MKALHRSLTALSSWLHAHPYKVILFTVLFTALAVAAAFRDDWIIPIACIYTMLVWLWVIVAWHDTRPKQKPNLMILKP